MGLCIQLFIFPNSELLNIQNVRVDEYQCSALNIEQAIDEAHDEMEGPNDSREYRDASLILQLLNENLIVCCRALLLLFCNCSVQCTLRLLI